jgi:hypothetical protein
MSIQNNDKIIFVFANVNPFFQLISGLQLRGVDDFRCDSETLRVEYPKDIKFYFLNPGVIAFHDDNELQWDAQQVSFFGVHRVRLFKRRDGKFFAVTGDGEVNLDELMPKGVLTYVNNKKGKQDG